MLARSPRARGKTRLTAALAPTAAEALRQALLLDAIDARLTPGWPLHVFIEPPEDVEHVQALLRDDPGLAGRRSSCVWHAQVAGDLGLRMTDAMTRTLASGHEGVVLIGSDSPDLPARLLDQATRQLLQAEPPGVRRLVLGPAEDGGFYLVASRHAEAAAFDGVTWSQATVLADVRARAEAAGRDVVLLGSWRDVDTVDDLRMLLTRSAGAPRTRAVVNGLPPPYTDS